MLHHDGKGYVEEYLMESGVAYTILQPTHFMDNFPVREMMGEEAGEVVFPVMWDPEIGFCFVAVKDLGMVGKMVLEEREKHFLACYPIVGTERMSYNEVCGVVGRVIGKEVRVEKRGFEESVDTFLSMMFGGRADSKIRDATERMLLYYNRHGLVGNKNVLEWLIGRKATGYQEWAQGMKEDITTQ